MADDPNETPDEVILLVDDEPDIRESLSAALANNGYKSIVAAHGKIAQDILQARKAKFGEPRVSVIVSDWQMPECDGIQLLHAIRTGEFKTLPFVLVSGAVTREQLVAALKLGADTVVLKPFDSNTLIRKIQEAIELRLQKELRNY